MSPQSLRNRFSSDALETASPAKIVVMAFDRLDRDLAGALVAIESKQIERSHELLVHAQDLVNELRCMLDLDAWEHAPKLASIYEYVGDLLVRANMRKSQAEVQEARTLLADIGDAFRQAAVAPSPAPAPTAAAPAASKFAAPSAPAPSATPRPALAGSASGSGFSAIA